MDTPEGREWKFDPNLAQALRSRTTPTSLAPMQVTVNLVLSSLGGLQPLGGLNTGTVLEADDPGVDPSSVT